MSQIQQNAPADSISELSTRVLSALPCLKLFPFGDGVLLPGGTTPLHIFEPRYLALVKDAIESDAVLALGLPAALNGETTVGSPPVHRRCGVGVIAGHQEIEDGRLLILLHGVSRIDLTSELDTSKSYRCFSATPVGTETVSLGPSLIAKSQLVRSLLGKLSENAQSPDARAGLSKLMKLEIPAHEYADLVASTVASPPAFRQALLESEDAEIRLDMVCDRLSEMMVNQKPRKSNQETAN